MRVKHLCKKAAWGGRKATWWQKVVLILFGLLLATVVIEIGLRLGGFVLVSLREYSNRAALQKKDAYRIMCVGESTTFCGGNKDSYPAQLEEILNQRHTGIRFSVINKGAPGRDSTFILEQLEDWLKTYNPQMVIVMMGINDASPSIHFESRLPRKRPIFSNLKIFTLARLLRQHIAARIYASVTDQPAKDRMYAQARDECKQQDGDTAAAQGLLLAEDKSNKPQRDSGESTAQKWRVCIDTGNDFFLFGQFDQAAVQFKKATEIDPANYKGYMELGRSLMELHRYAEAKESFASALKFTTNDRSIYGTWGWIAYTIQGFAESERILKEGLAADPENSRTYYVLGRLYHTSGKYEEAVRMYKEAIRLDPTNDFAYGGLWIAYNAMGDSRHAQEIFARASVLQLEFYSPILRDNYLALKSILDKRKIRLVCVQYPMRNVEALKKVFPKPEGMAFVDNGKIFLMAVRKTGYKDYFTDVFAGDFGHCTRKGYRLLAGNIADTILTEMFH